MLEFILPLYIASFTVLTYLTAKAQNKNVYIWLIVGILTGAIGYIALRIFEKTPKLALAGVNNLNMAETNIQEKRRPVIKSSVPNVSLEENRTTEKSNILRFEDDFVTCPNCRILSPIEADKCKVCGKDLIQ